MKLRCLVLASLVLASLSLRAQAEARSPGTCTLFLSSTPIGADVLRDGEALDRVTPLLLRDLRPGRHTFEVRKQGYSFRVVTVTLEPGEVKNLSVNLGGEYLLPSFPEERRVAIRGVEESAEDRLFQLPQGIYAIRRGEGGLLEIEPRYRLEGWVTGLDLAVPLALAFSGILVAHDAAYPKRAALPLGPGLSLSPATLSAFGVSLALVGIDVTLHVLKTRFLKSFRYTPVAARETLHQAREYFDRAESLLSLGQLEEAQRFYTVVLEGYRGSPLVPEALFKIARIHAIAGEETMAAMELGLLVERYPTPELYDKARKSLADLALARGDYGDALGQLAGMVFADPVFAPEEIDQYGAEILAAWADSDPAVVPRAADAYLRLIDLYPDSKQGPRYRYEAARYLHRGERDAEAAAQLESIDLEGLDALLAAEIRSLRTELRGER